MGLGGRGTVITGTNPYTVFFPVIMAVSKETMFK